MSISHIWAIMQRDLSSYFRSWLGYVVLAAALFIDGVWFNAMAISDQPETTEIILKRYFWYAGGTHLVAAVFLSMRMIAEERELGTLALLTTSPVRDSEIVLGKFLAGATFLLVLALGSAYCPVLLMTKGKIAFSHLITGYIGVLLLSAAGLAIAMLCSTLAPNQLVSVILSAAVVIFFVVFWAVAAIADPPVRDIIRYLAFFDMHFKESFVAGVLSLRDVVFYLSIIYLCLVASTRVLEARRWR